MTGDSSQHLLQEATEQALVKQFLDGDPGAYDRLMVLLEPMLGRASGSEHLLLYRTVLVGEQGYRQGLVIDRLRLGSWLERRVLTSSGLADAARCP